MLEMIQNIFFGILDIASSQVCQLYTEIQDATKSSSTRAVASDFVF